MSFLPLALWLCAATPEPTVAVLPPTPEASQETWLGYFAADVLTSGLLNHRVTDRNMGTSTFPLSVFSWRQALAAARSESIDTSRPLSARQAVKLARQLGAQFLITGSYAMPWAGKG